MTPTAPLAQALAGALPGAQAYHLMGEDLAALTGADLARAADAYRAAVAALPAPLRAPFEAEHQALAADVHAFLRRYNTSLTARIAGYVALGRRLDFAYPWPIVAILGLTQVRAALGRVGLLQALAPVVQRIMKSDLERIMDRSSDVLRRTNRSIFADSVPTTLFAAHCHAVRASGRGDLADALLAGPPPLLVDAHGAAVARRLAAGLAEPDPARRFADLAALTAEQFDREQAIFTHHLGGPRASGAGAAPARRPLAARLLGGDSVAAPVVVGPPGARRLVFRPYRLPAGFDMRDHAARVHHFGRAFVASVTGSAADYAAATRWVLDTHGR